MIRAVLSNPSHPEYGVVTITLPISRAQYDDAVRELEELEIGAVAIPDCHVDEIYGAWPVLNRLEGQVVDLDELDYLIKRLDSFDTGEAAFGQIFSDKNILPQRYCLQ